ncbi:MAG: DnaD domain-containing protein [Anaerolineae bacterium]
MKSFSGFPAGKVRFTSIPNLFFSELLPAIDDLAELKVTLHIFWLLSQKRGYPRYVSFRELSGDGVLLGSLKSLGQGSKESLREGLERAVARGTLLHAAVEQDGKRDDIYFMNTDQGRQAVEKIRGGQLELGMTVLPAEPPVEVERPNIFDLYEQNIGLLQPLIAEQLKDAEQTFPSEWIEEAFQIAVEQNKRSWAYVRAILERWATEGKDDGKGKRDSRKDRRRYIEGKYAEYIEH